MRHSAAVAGRVARWCFRVRSTSPEGIIAHQWTIMVHCSMTPMDVAYGMNWIMEVIELPQRKVFPWTNLGNPSLRVEVRPMVPRYLSLEREGVSFRCLGISPHPVLQCTKKLARKELYSGKAFSGLFCSSVTEK